ncbi:MAG: ferrous iron transport protein A [Promethearchaeota archaeon]
MIHNNYSTRRHHRYRQIDRLSNCQNGEEVIVLRVHAGYMAKKRLANLGIIPGVKMIKKRSALFRGPIEIIVKGSCLVIGRGLASKIMVKKERT